MPTWRPLSSLFFVLGTSFLGLTTIGPNAVQAAEPHCVGPSQRVAFECQSWTDINTALQNGTRTIIIPIGGTEQSGPFIDVGKHNIRAEALATAIAERLGQTFVAPVIAYVPEGGTSPRTSHMRFPGTISIPPAIFSGLIEGAAESFHVQGFRYIVFLGDHGGYQTLMTEAAQTLNKRWKGQAYAIAATGYYDAVPHAFADELRSRGYAADVGKHAELSDTSLMLAVDPSLVHSDALRHASKPSSADGVYGGDPRRASAALGEIGTSLQIQAGIAAIQSFKEQHP
ncbi:creatininase [Neokomagataea thailandica NBRC 106555]|uniref:Creatininase family protein n=2 Tax=Neokomagataea TaxID=1223423 RepID=A0A4Y6V7B6_9PROT|nr:MULTISPECIES: creatininase family protein [Neokomagataea]QDH24748.1 creatininase family protein [Neokomagataea tanensis]GBR53677.1 creatininase [Neokomagataea thailandica NBRC 106555]